MRNKITITKKRWDAECEYCGATEYDFQQPYCKGCCHIQKKDIKMFKIKK